MKIDILGTEYEVIVDAPDILLPENADGALDQSIKRIVVAKFEPDRNSIRDYSEYRKKVLRHEVIHAFLYESGVWNNSNEVGSWATNEGMVDWMAIQSPKILKVFQKMDIL